MPATFYVGNRDPNFKMQKTPHFFDEWAVYSENPKLTSSVSHLKYPIDFFNYIINEPMRQKIIEHTNKNLHKYGCNLIDDVEFNAYMGIMLLLGYLKKHLVSLDKIWNVSNPHHLDLAICAMPRDRFKDISSLISFDDPTTRHQRCLESKLFRIEEIFSIFQENIYTGIHPGKCISVDETLYSFRGRCPIRQYIPSKPAKYGIKYWGAVCVESTYISRSFIYTGEYIKDLNLT